MRLFVAIELPMPTVEGIPRTSTPGSPTHLTLRFLGEVDPVRTDSVRSALEGSVSLVPSFRLRLAGVGAFPSRHRPRVVWAGVSDGRTEVMELESKVSRALAGVGFPAEPLPFVPHVTLFRVRSRSEASTAAAILEANATTSFGRVDVTDVLLKQSILTREGATHLTVARVPLLRGLPSSVA